MVLRIGLQLRICVPLFTCCTYAFFTLPTPFRTAPAVILIFESCLAITSGTMAESATPG